MKKLTGRVVMEGDCWLVDGKRDAYALLALRDGSGKADGAHRLVYRTFNPDADITGMHVHHECRNPGCINPAHLEALTPAEHKRRHATC